MSKRKNYILHAERGDLESAKDCLRHAEIRLKGEERGMGVAERGLVDTLLRSANRHLSRVVRTDETSALEVRIAAAHRLRAALDCRLARSDFRVVEGGKGMLS